VTRSVVSHWDEWKFRRQEALETAILQEETRKKIEQLLKEKIEEVMKSQNFIKEIQNMIELEMKKIKQQVLKETQSQKIKILEEVRKDQEEAIQERLRAKEQLGKNY